MMSDMDTDITQITSITELKALAYDQFGVLEQVQANIQVINNRIRELQAEEPE